VSAAAYRARSATELIDALFQVLRRNFSQFFTLALMFYVPIAVVSRLFVPTSVAPAASPSAAFFMAFFVFFFLFIILSAVFQTAMFYACSDAYLGRTVNLSDVLKRAVRRAGSMAYGYFLQGICVLPGFVLFVIPGIIIALILFAVPCVIAFENVPAAASLSRSSHLSSGLKGHIFLTLFLVFIVNSVGLVIVTAVSTLVAGGIGHVTALSQTVSVLGTSLLVPLLPLAVTMLYYDARIRKEGFDIELMAQQTGAVAAATA
jgi:hypothetical protein